jgi:hypothetical protein
MNHYEASSAVPANVRFWRKADIAEPDLTTSRLAVGPLRCLL